MQRIEVMEQLQKYFVEQVLDGRNIGLDETTPLLEWGLINSIEIVRLLSFIHTRFDVEIPTNQLLADNLANIGKLTDTILNNHPALSTSGPDSIR